MQISVVVFFTDLGTGDDEVKTLSTKTFKGNFSGSNTRVTLYTVSFFIKGVFLSLKQFGFPNSQVCFQTCYKLIPFDKQYFKNNIIRFIG